jgi:hypothetical protein
MTDLALVEGHYKEKMVNEVEEERSGKISGSDALPKCCACMEAIPSKNILTLRCEPEAHEYCRNCLEDLFASAIDNPTLFPPTCCKLPIPLEECRALLPKELVKKFDLKVEELATPNPTYCSNAECSEFIRPREIKAEIATCVFCAEKTCIQCKCKSHEGLCLGSSRRKVGTPDSPHSRAGRLHSKSRCKAATANNSHSRAGILSSSHRKVVTPNIPHNRAGISNNSRRAGVINNSTRRRAGMINRIRALIRLPARHGTRQGRHIAVDLLVPRTGLLVPTRETSIPTRNSLIFVSRIAIIIHLKDIC